MASKLSNDDKYQKLMERYKKLRRDPAKRVESLRALDAAQKMDIDGLVSENVVTAWQYLG
jgi:hypothetical protein